MQGNKSVLEVRNLKGGENMKYQIEYADGMKCKTVNSREELLKCLDGLKNETITDIRKLYKSGVSDSVLGIYEPYIIRNKNALF